jgi:hypothetical protein
MSNNNKNNNNNNSSSFSSSKKRKHGVDTLLQTLGKTLPVGGTLRFALVKGPHPQLAQPDPVDSKAPKQAFPLLAKFPESVVPPDFTKLPWSRHGRLYQQDVPKAVDDSDDDDDDEQQQDATKKKRRWRPLDAPKRQWILQEQVEFLETMVARRQQKQGATTMTTDPTSNANNSNSKNQLSSRYEGGPEHNASHYILLRQQHTLGGGEQTLSCQKIPVGNSTILFTQPHARKTYSLSQAETAMEQQRGLIRTLHTVPAGTQGATAAAAAMTRTTAVTNNSKNRLLHKLLSKQTTTNNDKAGDDDDDDDVMKDVAFRSRKKKTAGGGAARKELLHSLADNSVRVGEDGVLGGMNDAIFAARQRFSAFQTTTENNNNNNNNNGNHGKRNKNNHDQEQERGADGAAMEDDFYHRDVQAEYEEMDFDANELFDDDDVDVGETEVGFDEGDYEGEDDEEEDDDLDQEEEAVSGAEGLASVAGFKLMLAKARGELANASAEASEAAAAEAEGKKDEDAGTTSPAVSPKTTSETPSSIEKGDHIAKIMAAADKAAQAAKEKASQPAGKKAPDAAAIQVDENGLRIITLEAVRKEIWLNHGSIPMKRLMKIFDIKKKSSPDRQDAFRNVVKELCTMKNDPIGGRLLVLKQHYSNL